MTPQIQTLLQLQTLDQELEHITSGLENFPKEIVTFQRQIQAEKDRLTQTKNRASELEVRKKELELEVKTQEEKLKKYEAELNSVKSNDIYKALLLEIEHAKTEKEKFEDQILELMLEIDEQQARTQKTEVSIKTEIQNIEKSIVEKEQKLQQLKGLVDGKTKARAAYAATIVPEDLKLYTKVSHHSGTSVLAEIQGDICAGCYTSLTQSMLNEIRKHKTLFTCESCSRIVYFVEGNL